MNAFHFLLNTLDVSFKLSYFSEGENLVNLDNVTQVARDCLLARMEAIILQVWKSFIRGDIQL